MSSLDLNKLKRRTSIEIFEQPKKKIDRFNGLSEEEVQKYTLEDYLEMDLDIVFVGINPSLMAAHRGRYYAGPGNHFYKLLHESGLTPKFVNFEEDYKLLQYGIGLTNIVTRATRSAADLKRIEIKEGAGIVEKKLKLYKPKIAVFNGKCIYEVFANITNRSVFHFGLQTECLGNTAIWVTPSSSARCANFPRMVDKLPFYTALKKYLQFLKGEIIDVNVKEFWFEGKCKQIVPSTSKMWRRKNISTFMYGGRIVNRNTLCRDTSEEDIAEIHTAEFLVKEANQRKNTKDVHISLEKEIYNQNNKNHRLLNESMEKNEKNIEKIRKVVDEENKGIDRILINTKSENNESSINNKNENTNNTINIKSNCKNKMNNISRTTSVFSKVIKKDLQTRHCSRNNISLDFVSLIKQRLSQKNNSNVVDIASITQD